MADDHQEDIMTQSCELFTCQICLDIVYKPIVLRGCGHVFCFWCLKRSMNDRKPSHCPTCRHAYLHFPRVCRLLHLLLQKAWPLPYQRKATETQAMEQKMTAFSSPSSSSSSRTCHQGPPHSEPSNAGSCNDHHASKEFRKLHVYPEVAMEAAEMAGVVGVEDVSCSACRRLLYRPVVINCGEVLCEGCWNDEREVQEVASSNPVSSCCCKWCGGVHPRGGPVRVCLALHHFLAKTFPTLYAQRALDAPTDLSTTATTPPDDSEKREREDDDEDIEENDGFVHVGVGCDGCGMFPIVSRERYHCLECGDHVGYDLCPSCFDAHGSNAIKCGGSNHGGVEVIVSRDEEGIKSQASPTSVLANESMSGRFDQRHTVEHQMVMVESKERAQPATFNSVLRIVQSRIVPLQLDIQSRTILRRRHSHRQIMDDFDDYIDSLV